MSTESDNTNCQVVFTGIYETEIATINTAIDGWTDDFMLQLAEAISGLTFPEGCSIKVQKAVDVLTTYDADTTVSPAVFD
jgi:hypothetical protein